MAFVLYWGSYTTVVRSIEAKTIVWCPLLRVYPLSWSWPCMYNFPWIWNTCPLHCISLNLAKYSNSLLVLKWAENAIIIIMLFGFNFTVFARIGLEMHCMSISQQLLELINSGMLLLVKKICYFLLLANYCYISVIDNFCRNVLWPYSSCSLINTKRNT